MYIDKVDSCVNVQRNELSSIVEVNNIIKNFYEKPFDIEVDLRSLNIDQCKSLTQLLKKWLEDVIKKQSY